MTIETKKVLRNVGLFVIVMGLLVFGVVKPFCESIWRDIRGKVALHTVYQVSQALSVYVSQYDGNFPAQKPDGQPFTNSNEAFRELFRKGVFFEDGQAENIFYLQGSAWHNGKGPDRNTGSAATDFFEALAKHENHWAYVTGLNLKTSDPNTPLVMDGFSETIGVWSKDPSKKGGVWEGEFAIIVTVAGRCHKVPLDEEGRPMKTINGKLVNLLDLIPKTPGVKILNPDG